MNYNFFGIGMPGFSFIFLLIIWTMIWKGIGLWKSGRNNHLIWFILIFVLNTAGILPIIYLAFFQKKETISKRKRK